MIKFIYQKLSLSLVVEMFKHLLKPSSWRFYRMMTRDSDSAHRTQQKTPLAGGFWRSSMNPMSFKKMVDLFANYHTSGVWKLPLPPSQYARLKWSFKLGMPLLNVSNLSSWRFFPGGCGTHFSKFILLMVQKSGDYQLILENISLFTRFYTFQVVQDFWTINSSTWKLMVGIQLTFWDLIFSGAVLVVGRVYHIYCIYSNFRDFLLVEFNRDFSSKQPLAQPLPGWSWNHFRFGATAWVWEIQKQKKTAKFEKRFQQKGDEFYGCVWPEEGYSFGFSPKNMFFFFLLFSELNDVWQFHLRILIYIYNIWCRTNPLFWGFPLHAVFWGRKKSVNTMILDSIWPRYCCSRKCSLR